MQIDIYIREKSGSREIRIPLLPEKFSFPSGDATFITNDIMGLGEVLVPSGTELATYSWQSELPGSLRKNDPMMRGAWKAPDAYISILEDWKRNGTMLNLLITGYPINTDVYCKQFSTEGAGPFGDVAYDIQFIEARSITITTTKVEKTQETKRQTTSSKTYTIKSGDRLWTIAQKHYGAGSKWQTIYEANKEIIEQTAKAHKRTSSQNGHWIYPGTVITIP